MSSSDAEERAATMAHLEGMAAAVTDDDDDDEQGVEVSGLSDMEGGMMGDDGDEYEDMSDDDEDDDDEEEEEEEDDDDDFIPDDDDEIFVEMDEEDGDEGDGQAAQDDGDEEEETVISIADLIRAAAASRDPDASAEQRQSPAAAILSSIGIQGLRRLLATGSLRGLVPADDDDDDDEEPDEYWLGHGRGTKMSEFWDPIKEPVKAGRELALGGDFGRPPARPPAEPKSAFARPHDVASIVQDRRYARRRVPKVEMSGLVPNSDGIEVARYPARCYCGQYSEDSSFFYTCTQDFRVQLYDTTVNQHQRVRKMEEGPSRIRSRYTGFYGTTQYTNLKVIKTIQGRQGQWTITDANLSPDNAWMIYSSITPYVHLVPTREDVESGGRSHSDAQVMLDFSSPGRDDVGIWSIRFSGDSREIVAGAHHGGIYVYDIEARRRVLRVRGHEDDVNAVAFADSASSNVLISGSDDSFVKVWDRRSLSGGKPAGVLPGHTEGITFVAPKGDGRYCVSNGKDQSAKLWDLRSMQSSQDFDSMPDRSYGLRNWDYRNMFYKKPRFQAHPEDRSVMTYRGHAVLKTLIRCHFSPVATTGQNYIFSGSADGRIHIWSLDGRVVQVLDRSKTAPMLGPNGMAVDPSAPTPASQVEAASRPNPARARGGFSSYGAESCTVRDVSWHSSEPTLMSTSWDGPEGQAGSIAKHEWKGFGKNGLSLEDAIAKTALEAAG